MKTPPASLRYPVVSAAFAGVLATLPLSLPAAGTFTWNGATNGGWATVGNATQTTNWVGNVTITSDNQTDLIFNTTTKTLATAGSGSFIGSSRTVRSLSYGSGINANIATSFNFFNSTAANLTMAADTGNASITVDSGATGSITLGAANSVGSAWGALVLSSSLDVVHNGSGQLIFNRAVTGSGALTKTGTGTLVFSSNATSANTYSGLTTVSGGTLSLSKTANLDAIAGNVLVNGTGTLSLAAAGQIKDTSNIEVAAGTFALGANAETVNGVKLSGGNITGTSGVLTSTTAYDLQSGTITAILAGAAGATKSTAGTVTLSGSNTFTGTLAINNGTLIASGTANATISDVNNASSINLGGGTLQINSNGLAKTYATAPIVVSAASTLAWNNTSNSTSAILAISGAGSFAINSNLTVQNISANTTAANQFNISRALTGNGTLFIETYNDIQSINSVFTPGRIQLQGNSTGFNGNIVISKGTLQLSGVTGTNLLGNGSLTIGTTDSSIGAGLSFNTSSDQTITNTIIVNRGGFRGIKNNSSGGAFNISLNGGITLNGDLTVDQGLDSGRTFTLGGNIGGSGNLTIARPLTTTGTNAASKAVITGNNSYTGNTNIESDANLEINSASGNGIGDTSAVRLTGANATLTLTTAETIGSLASSGSVGTLVLNNNLTTGGNNQSTNYGGNSTGAGSLTKVGSGTMTLSGVNGYTGATNVNEGTLIVSGSIASTSTNIAPGAVLTFTGSASAGNISIGSGASFALGTAGTAGAVTINGGTLTGAGTVGSLAFTGSSAFSPGNSPGTVTLADGGSLTMSSGTVSNFEITSSLFTPGSYDLVIGTAGGAAESVAFDGILNLVFTGTGYSVSATAVKLFDVDSYSGSFSAINVTGLDAGLVATFNSSTGYVSIAAIPEPSSIAVLAGFGALVFVSYRRRRQVVKAA